MNKRFNEASEHGGESSKSRSVLSRLNVQELKLIKVAIRRHNVAESTAAGPLQRTLENPEDLHIHRLGKKPIFDREDIVVNNEEHLEERIVLKSPVRDTGEGVARRSRSNDREHSQESYRSRSSRNHRSYSRSPSKTRKDSERKPPFKEYQRSPAREKQKSDDYRSKQHAEGSKRRSPSPSYKRGEPDRYEYKSRAAVGDKYYRERSPKPGTSRGTGDRERSPKGRNDGYRKDKYSPKRYDKHRSRTPSPKKLHYRNGTDKDKYARARTPPTAHSRRHSVSPHAQRRSRSPYSRKRSSSPHSKRHSRSPHFKRTPPREDQNFGSSGPAWSKSKRRSGSPYEREKNYASSSHRSGYSGPSHSKRRTPSPYSRRHSRSPHRSRKRSRSPSRRDHRGRSRSPARTRKHSESDDRYRRSPSGDRSEYRGVPPDFRYYGAEGYWVPGPMPRPGFIPRGPIMPPPMGIPRVFGPEGPYMFQRPYLPVPHALPQFRPRFPPYNRPYRPRISASPTTSGSVAASSTVTTNAVAQTVSTSTVPAEAPVIEESAEPIVEECVDNADSTEKS